MPGSKSASRIASRSNSIKSTNWPAVLYTQNIVRLEVDDGNGIRPIITVSPVNDELLAAVGKLTAEYGRIGGNLNQIARTLNEWHSPYPQLAGEVRAAVSDLAALKFEVLQKVGDAVGNIQTYQL